MGSCFSKKTTNSSSQSSLQDPHPSLQITTKIEPEKPKIDDEQPKKEIFIIKHRKSNDRRSDEEKPPLQKVTEFTRSGNSTISSNLTNCGSENGSGIVVSTQIKPSSCTKEELEGILIQCGRLSRSSSMGKAAISGGSCDNTSTPRKGKRYSGLKRSYDLDKEGCNNWTGPDRYDDNVIDDDDETVVDKIQRHRQRHRQAGDSPHSRRRTPSREREHNSEQRSGSRERTNGGRRVSQSPGRRSESPITSSGSAAAGPQSVNNNNGRPGKMVSVPATVSSMVMDKSNNSGGGVKRIQVKRNVGAGDQIVGLRTAASPRSQSPARTNLSRSNSRKAEHSPYRRNPLSEIDNNATAFEQSAPFGNKGQMKKPNVENVQVLDTIGINKGILDNNAAANVICPQGPENPKPQTLTRTRSARKSRDLDINPESLTNPTSSYTALLLEDIQNFHQKNNETPSFSLPPCLTKACSILEAVADLNSTNSSNLSSVFTDDRRRNPTTDENSSTRGKKRVDVKEMMESEIIGSDDLLQPSVHKYVTVRRGPGHVGSDMEEQESSGSNSCVGGPPHQWLSSSWEPNSVDSTDCFTSSTSNVKENVGIQRRTESDNRQNGIGRGRVGIGRMYTAAST